MKKYRLKSHFDGQYSVETKFLFFWVSAWVDYDGNTHYGTRYGTYENASWQLHKFEQMSRVDDERRQRLRIESNLRKAHVPTYIYPPLPENEPLVLP